MYSALTNTILYSVLESWGVWLTQTPCAPSQFHIFILLISLDHRYPHCFPPWEYNSAWQPQIPILRGLIQFFSHIQKIHVQDTFINVKGCLGLAAHRLAFYVRYSHDGFNRLFTLLVCCKWFLFSLLVTWVRDGLSRVRSFNYFSWFYILCHRLLQLLLVQLLLVFFLQILLLTSICTF